jgi:Flp pilus assembly protein TadG
MLHPHSRRTRTRTRTRATGRPAAATVELAILLPLLVFLFAVGVDFARIFNPYLTITNSARSGALYGSQSTTNSTDTAGITAAALADAGDLSPPPTVTSTTLTDVDGNPCVEVTVTWTFQSVTNLPGIPSSLNITRTVRMRVQPTVPKNS